MAREIEIPQLAIMQALGKAIEILIRRYDELDLRATGNWAEALEAKVENNRGLILGLDYTKYMAQGRPSGKPAPVRDILDWMLAKKSFKGEKSLGRAIAISKTIGKQGTRAYQKGGTDILDILKSSEISDVFNEEMKIRLIAVISENLRTVVKTVGDKL